MKKKTINQPERYEAPRVRVKMLRKRAMIAASLCGSSESYSENDGSYGSGSGAEGYGESNGNW